MATVHCPHCQASLELFKSASGRVVVCPECNTQFHAPKVTPIARFFRWSVGQLKGALCDIKAMKLTRRVLVLAAIVCLLVVGSVLESPASDSHTVDVRRVAVDPHAYAGMTLRSRAKMLGDGAFMSQAQRGSLPLYLHVPDSLTAKAERARMATTGEHDYVIIEYEIYPQAKLDGREEPSVGTLPEVNIP